MGKLARRLSHAGEAFSNVKGIVCEQAHLQEGNCILLVVPHALEAGAPVPETRMVKHGQLPHQPVCCLCERSSLH